MIDFIKSLFGKKSVTPEVQQQIGGLLSTELKLKDKVAPLFDDPKIISLLQNKTVEVKPGVTVNLNSDLKFRLVPRPDNLRIEFFSTKPTVNISGFISLEISIAAISVFPNKIIVELDGCPDYTIKLI